MVGGIVFAVATTVGSSTIQGVREEHLIKIEVYGLTTE